MDDEAPTHAPSLPRAQLRLEYVKLFTDVAKWLAAGLGAALSFWVIDVGRLNLEKTRAAAEDQRALLQAYMQAMETTAPDVWLRKLQVLENLASDATMKDWARQERERVQNYSARDALYLETLRVASKLIGPDLPANEARTQARQRFEQLYWADLPFAHEDPAVARAMVHFRNALRAADAKPDVAALRDDLNSQMISLSQVLSENTKLHPPSVPQ